jgi:hypothetical protein
VLANHFNERADKQISVRIDGTVVATGLTKPGALIGDGSRVGANAVTSPETLLPPETAVATVCLSASLQVFEQCSGERAGCLEPGQVAGAWQHEAGGRGKRPLQRVNGPSWTDVVRAVDDQDRSGSRRDDPPRRQPPAQSRRAAAVGRRPVAIHGPRLWQGQRPATRRADPLHSIVTNRNGEEGEYKLRGIAVEESHAAIQARYAHEVAARLGWRPSPGSSTCSPSTSPTLLTSGGTTPLTTST